MTTVPEQIAGLKWITGFCCLLEIKPRWSIDPHVERIKEVVIPVLLAGQNVSVSFFGEGSFNKLYSIPNGNEEAILRMSLPVDPHWKTLSEVATMEWISRNTTLPVPKVIAHDASRDNSIGFEWILMSKIPGKPLADAWRSIDFEAKKEVTRQWAISAATMLKKQLRGIGNIYPLSKLADVDGGELPEVKRIVSMEFFWGDRISRSVPRGPFHSSKDWLLARLLLMEGDAQATMARCNGKKAQDSDDLYDIKVASRSLRVVGRLRLLMKDFFPTRKEEDAEPWMLFHGSPYAQFLHMHNLLVDEAGCLTGVVDWECVSALPLWKAWNFPNFLRGPIRSYEPAMESYVPEDGFSSDNLSSNLWFYWNDLQEYDTTRLRESFLEEMRCLEPGGVRVFKASEQLRDLDVAVEHLSRRGMTIEDWIDMYLSGDNCSLFDMLEIY